MNGHQASFRSRLALVCLPLAGIAASAFLAMASPGAAQVRDLNMWQIGSCSTCHGGFAQGGRAEGDPRGPNLRQTRLDREAVRETIACGRGEMPYHLEGAYLEVPCYGLPVGNPPPEERDAGRQFSADELDALVDFLFENVVGVPLTRQTCAVYFGGDEDYPACAQFSDAP